MSAEPVMVFGMGGHGRAVAEAAQGVGHRLVGYVDDAAYPDEPAWLGRLESVTVDGAVVLGIGDNAQRQAAAERVRQAGRELMGVTHSQAWVSPSAGVRPGVFVGPRAVLHTQVMVGDGAVINTAAVVEHGSEVGAFAHIAPGVVLGGQVKVGRLALVGLGARVLPGVSIGERAKVGAGAVVLADVPEGVTVTGLWRG